MSGSNALILVVDDVATMRETIKSRLLRAGFRVVEAGDGAEALARVDAERPDLVLLDVEMPVMDGMEALRRLRERHAKLDLPVIMVTSRSSGDDVVAAFEKGANDYVYKPFDAEILLSRLQTQLEMRDAYQRLRARHVDPDSVAKSVP